jgi:N-acyl-D-amino-acid deacylase
MEFDLMIRGGRVLDGTGNPFFYGDVGICGDRIAAVERSLAGAPARRTIDAAGLTVAPGFIDTHTHSDLMVLAEPLLEPKLRQGITTDLLCQDGISVAPTRPEHSGHWRRYIAGLDGEPGFSWSWATFDEYLQAVEAAGPGLNMAALVPQGNIRQWVLGLENRAPSPGELAQMGGLIAECMEAGAFGMSIGLIYLPCLFSAREELIEQYRVVARYGGIMVIHMRNEADYWLEAIDETIGIAEAAGVGLLISHFKAVGRQNWHKMETALAKLEAARARGVDVSFDQYPYTAGSTILSALLPPWAVEGGTGPMLSRLSRASDRARINQEIEHGLPPEAGGWDNLARCAGWEGISITSVRSEANRWMEGKRLTEIASARGVDPSDAAFDLLLEEGGAVGMIDFIASEECIRQALASDLQMVCTDGLLLGSKPHPRSYGAFPRVLGKYVRDEQVLSLQQAVRHMTSMPAQRLGLMDRGLLRAGMRADVVLFNAATVADRATYMEPRQFPEGIPFVIVGGQVAVDQGRTTGVRAGQVLRRGRA